MTRSTFPPTVDELLPRAQDMAAQEGKVPSLNRLKAELRIGTDKARAVRDALTPTPDTDQPDTPPSTASTVGAPEHTDETVPDLPAPTVPEPAQASVEPVALPLASPLASTPEHTPTAPAPAAPTRRHPIRTWPVLLLALPAFVAIWSGWVGLGELTGFGVVHPLPGIWDQFSLNSAITLPIGVETYAAYALRVWLSSGVPGPARRFARWSATGSLMLGAAGQVAYHLMAAQHVTHAPWWITTLVASLPVAVLGMGAALAHLVRNTD